MWCLDAIGLGASLALERGLGILWVIGVSWMSCAPKLADLGTTKNSGSSSQQSSTPNDESLCTVGSSTIYSSSK